MEFRRKVTAGALLSLVTLLVALASIGCGSSPGAPTTSIVGPTTTSSATTSTAGPTTTSSATTSSAESTTSSSASASAGDRQAAEAYFAAMAPTIDKDYQALQWLKQAMSEWQQTYGNSDLSTNRQAWNALSLIIQQALAKEQEIIQGYGAVTPSETFRTAHAALLENNRDGNIWAKNLIAAIKASRPTSELMSTLSAGPPGPSNSEVLSEFQSAAARVGIQIPTKLIDAYSDGTDSSGNLA